jgi:hypothetical protein
VDAHADRAIPVRRHESAVDAVPHRYTGRWERYPLLGSTTRIEPLLKELELDPICVFWG